MVRDAGDNYVPDFPLMEAIGKATRQDPAKLRRIPIRLLYNDPDLNFATRYAAYSGRTLFCSGDGGEAKRLQKNGEYDRIDCPCERIEQGYAGPAPACKINGVLSVLIDGAGGVGGVWKFRTTSFNSVDGLMGSLLFMAGITGGQLANIPLDLVVNPKPARLPDGKQQTIYVVGLDFTGSVDALREEGFRIAVASQQANLRIEHIETEARRLFEGAEPDAVFPDEDGDDIVAEFYPESEQGEAPPIADPAAKEPKKKRGRKKLADVSRETSEEETDRDQDPPADAEAPAESPPPSIKAPGGVPQRPKPAAPDKDAPPAASPKKPTIAGDLF